MLRLRRLAVGCALGFAGAAVVFVFVAGLNFSYHAPALHVALETTAAITALAAAFLLLGRFGRTGFLDELILSAGLSLLAVSNLAFAALPAVLDLQSHHASAWSRLYTVALAGLLICVAALLPRRRLTAGPRWPVVVYSGTALLAAAGTVPMFNNPTLVPRGVAFVGPAHPSFAGSIVLALLSILAAFGFTRRYRLTNDELSGWLAVGCVLAGASSVNYYFHPATLSDWVYTGDVFRLGFYLALLIGAAREIASYWAMVVAAASLEERRRLARDVHDGLAQEIAFIGRNVKLLREQGATPQLVDRILQSVTRAQDESRRVVGALAARLDEPLDQALARAVREAAGRYGASVDMELASGIVLPPREREAVVRIASEAASNAARHSGADVLRLYLERLEAGMRLAVIDDGAGFDDDQPRSGFGLVTMKDRAEALGGKLRIDSRRGSGTKVELEL